MAVSLSLTQVTHLPGGGVLASGTVTFDASYPTGGETLDLSATFGGSPTVICGGDDGYVFVHNRGNAASGALLAYFANGAAAAGAALIQVTNATNLAAAIVPIIVMGTAAQS